MLGRKSGLRKQGLAKGDRHRSYVLGNFLWTVEAGQAPQCYDHPQLLLGGTGGWEGPAGEEPSGGGQRDPLSEQG